MTYQVVLQCCYCFVSFHGFWSSLCDLLIVSFHGVIFICLQGKQQFGTVADGNAPIKYPSFKAPKSSFGDGGKHSAIGKS